MQMKIVFLTLVLFVSTGCNSGSSITIDEQSTESPQVTSQATLVEKFAGASFVSVDQLEVGETATGGLAMGNWMISFTSDSVSWSYSDVIEVGTYSYSNSLMVANFSGREIVFSGDGNSINWDSRTYRRMASSVFDSQESLEIYFDGSTYKSVDQLDIGENALGELVMGNWSLRFTGDEVDWRVQDTVQAGTYSYTNGSRFTINFYNQSMTVYVLTGDQILVNSRVYEKDFSNLFNSQETLVAFLDGSTYKSAGLQQLGQTGDDTVAIGHWELNFSDDMFTWSYSDVVEFGNYNYLSANSFTAIFHDREYLIDVERGDIIWDGIRYIK